jgi:hypothetical protein
MEKTGTNRDALRVFGKTHVGQPLADFFPQGNFDHPERSPIGGTDRNISLYVSKIPVNFLISGY